jgi:hypothetical protein
MTTSAWFDLEELLKEREILVMDQLRNIIDPTEFCAHLSSDGNKKDAVGAGVRWAVAATDGVKL